MSGALHVDGTGGYLAPAIMSVNWIHQQDLFDEDDDDNAVNTAAAATDVPNDDINVNSGTSRSSSGCCINNSWRDLLTIVLLTAVNLINYMDRFSVAGKFVSSMLSAKHCTFLLTLTNASW